MKQSSRVVVSVSLIIAGVVIALGLVGLSTVFAASRNGEVNLILSHIDVGATAQAIRFQNRRAELENASQERLVSLQAQIDRLQNSLIQHNQTVQTQTAQQNNQLATLHAQTVKKQATVEALQSALSQVQQDIISEKDSHQISLNALIGEMQQTESEMLAELQAVTRQLQAAQAGLDAMATATPELLSPPLLTGAHPSQDGNSRGDMDNRHSEDSGDEKDSENKRDDEKSDNAEKNEDDD